MFKLTMIAFMVAACILLISAEPGILRFGRDTIDKSTDIPKIFVPLKPGRPQIQVLPPYAPPIVPSVAV